MKTLKVISALMTYPETSIQAYKDEMVSAIQQEGLLARSTEAALIQFINTLAEMDLLDAQEQYIDLFDRGRSLSLLLFEHVHGDSRDRGQAMVDLQNVYQRNGFTIAVRELPDHIPLFLEFLSEQPSGQALEWLAEVGHILALLATRLEQRSSPYKALFDSLLDLVDAEIKLDELRQKVAAEERDDTPAAIDKIWEEEMVRFVGDEQGGQCGSQETQAGQAAHSPQESVIHWQDRPKTNKQNASR